MRISLALALRLLGLPFGVAESCSRAGPAQYLRAPMAAAMASILAFAMVLGCESGGGKDAPDGAVAPAGPRVRALDLADPVRPAVHDHPISLQAAKNEAVTFALDVSGLPAPDGRRIYSLRLHPLRLENTNDRLPAQTYDLSQLVSMPVDLNRAAYVRHTGKGVEATRMPRALLPVVSDNGIVNLSAMRDPEDATNPQSRYTGRTPLQFWVDVSIPTEAASGKYLARCDLLESRNDRPLASVPIEIIVRDFVIPADRHLQMVARLDWDDLSRLYPEQFEAVRPKLLNRRDPAYAGAIQTLDNLLSLVQRHRAQLVMPRLQPTVKWHTHPPLIDWQDFDTVIAPWLTGEAFADKVPLGLWPLPAVDHLASYDPTSRLAYWAEAAAHFERNDWLTRAPVFLEKLTPGRASTAERIQFSVDAARVLAAHPRVRVAVPLEDEQLQFSAGSTTRPAPADAHWLDPASVSRLIAASPGLVSTASLQRWPELVDRPAHWLRTDLPGLLPYVGAGGSEGDVRLWSWLAFLRHPRPQPHGDFVLWGSPLPRTSSAAERAEPDDLVWFYPGHWFGLDAPVPTVQLKWLRRAQQDYEYLWLAEQRGEVINALLMARLITKPVEVVPTLGVDPTYGLLCGTYDSAMWDEAHRLLGETILLREPGQRVEPIRRGEHNLGLLRWAEPQDRHLLIPRSVSWLPDRSDDADPGRWVRLRLGLDVYNASDTRPDENTLAWSGVNPAWEVAPKPIAIPALPTYRIQPHTLDARVEIGRVTAADQAPVEVTFTDGFKKKETTLRLSLPVAVSERRRPGLRIDGRLDDWEPADAIHAGPLTAMLDRPSLQRQQLVQDNGQTSIFTAWSDERLYVAFDVSGASEAKVTETRNFVDYQVRRAWGEDVCEVLVQPVYDDGALGPVLHVACKPTGHWVERRTDPKHSADPWQPLEAQIPYYATLEGGQWRGEIAIPWHALRDPAGDRGAPPALPKMLRFNFSQHRHSTGQSASWAGPVDFGRDDAFTGLLVLREDEEPGI